MSRRTAWSLCSQSGILSAAQRRRRGKGTKAGPPVFDDHVQRMFTASAPNQVGFTDITEHWTAEGKLYCCAIKDACGHRVVGYSISDRMPASLAVDALNNAVARRRAEGQDVAGCILHADRGSQGGFNWSSQHLDIGGVHGQACGMDGGDDRAGADEVAGRAVASTRSGAGVLARDRQGAAA
jgi:transposase InsO family protein